MKYWFWGVAFGSKPNIPEIELALLAAPREAPGRTPYIFCLTDKVYSGSQKGGTSFSSYLSTFWAFRKGSGALDLRLKVAGSGCRSMVM